MIFVRLKHRFPERALEWFCAAQILSWGISFLIPYSGTASPYAIFEGIMGQTAWGAILIATGLLWLGGLVINGARNEVTSSIRAACATGGFVVSLLVATGFASAGMWTPQFFTFLLFAAASLYSVFRAGVDREVEK